MVWEELSAEAVSADIVPSIGTPLAVGKVVGKVILQSMRVLS
jgi:hypothetical protein